jgi:prevent-host-death family protein
MKNARISELRDNLSQYIARVRKGETLIVYDRNTPVARIEPIVADDEDLPDWAREAMQKGILSPPKVRSRKPLKITPVKADPRFSLLEALLEERQSGR